MNDYVPMRYCFRALHSGGGFIKLTLKEARFVPIEVAGKAGLGELDLSHHADLASSCQDLVTLQ